VVARSGRRRERGRGSTSRLHAVRRASIELADSSSVTVPAEALWPGQSQLARLASQLARQNRASLAEFGVSIEPRLHGDSVGVNVTSSVTIGALPLVSPVSGRPDHSIIVRPRFEWPGLGRMLATMGWRVLPQILPMPLLPQSERRIPPWVLATVVVYRLERLVRRLERRFEMVDEVWSAPRGSVNWAHYARRGVARGLPLRVPCRFPSLIDDRHLKAGVRFVVERQIGSLESQRSTAPFVDMLIGRCRDLLHGLHDVETRRPAPAEFEGWLRRPLSGTEFTDGLQAMRWTIDERGLAGLSDLEGLPWAMRMDEFFEAWVETVTERIAHGAGALVRTGRRRQTVTPISWDPPFLGSQKSLVPDVVMERGDVTVIIDAKYKEHWEELTAHSWSGLEEDIRERHRADLLQALAYANLAPTPRVTVALAYPCSRATWDSLKARGRLFHRAVVRADQKRVDLLLTAMPMGTATSEVSSVLAREMLRQD
jgi:5-methylcytosine-specific restriction endonuclease McrBC regulatory subunit McrC